MSVSERTRLVIDVGVREMPTSALYFNYLDSPSKEYKRGRSNGLGLAYSLILTCFSLIPGGIALSAGVEYRDGSQNIAMIATGSSLLGIATLSSLLAVRYMWCPEKRIFPQGCGPEYIPDAASCLCRTFN